MDWTPYRREMLAHCMFLAETDERYAIWAADNYEQNSCGVLHGLGQRVRKDIERRKIDVPKAKPSPTSRDMGVRPG